MPDTLLDRLNRFSPKLCRAMARSDDGLRPISHQNLGLRCGISKTRIIRLSKLDRWDSIELGVASAYAKACGIDLLRMRTSFFYKSRRFRSVLTHLNGNQRRLYDRLLPKRPT